MVYTREQRVMKFNRKPNYAVKEIQKPVRNPALLERKSPTWGIYNVARNGKLQYIYQTYTEKTVANSR